MDKTFNPINPLHYNRLDPQPKDVIRNWGLNFNLGSAVKYISRAGHKDDIVCDLKKAQEFIQFEIDAIEEQRAEQRARLGTPRVLVSMEDIDKAFPTSGTFTTCRILGGRHNAND